MTQAQKRIKKYMENPDTYWVYYDSWGCLKYYNVEEKGIGIIDRIQERTFNRAIELGIITHEQYKRHQRFY